MYTEILTSSRTHMCGMHAHTQKPLSLDGIQGWGVSPGAGDVSQHAASTRGSLNTYRGNTHQPCF